MRLVLPVFALLAVATAAEAQQQVRPLPDPVPVTSPELRAAPAIEAVPVLIAPGAATQDGSPEAAGTDVSQDVLDTRAEAPESAVVQQPPPNFWWLVGGIVLAGVILAVLL